MPIHDWPIIYYFTPRGRLTRALKGVNRMPRVRNATTQNERNKRYAQKRARLLQIGVKFDRSFNRDAALEKQYKDYIRDFGTVQNRLALYKASGVTRRMIEKNHTERLRALKNLILHQ